MTTLQQRLKAARKAAGKSQEAVAEAIKMSQPSYSELERGLSLSTSKIVEIAVFLGVSPEWLATGEGEMGQQPTDGVATEQEMLVIFKRLPRHMQEEIIRQAQLLERIENTPRQ